MKVYGPVVCKNTKISYMAKVKVDKMAFKLISKKKSRSLNDNAYLLAVFIGVLLLSLAVTDLKYGATFTSTILRDISPALKMLREVNF